MQNNENNGNTETVDTVPGCSRTETRQRQCRNTSSADTDARCAQEYCTSGLCDQDDRPETTNTHPYLYDGTPIKRPGFQKISAKYNLTALYEINLEFFVWCLTDALRTDIKNQVIPANGSINYAQPQWVTSKTLAEHFYYKNKYIDPQQGLPLTLARIIAQKTK